MHFAPPLSTPTLTAPPHSTPTLNATPPTTPHSLPHPFHTHRWKKLEHTMEEMDLPDEEVSLQLCLHQFLVSITHCPHPLLSPPSWSHPTCTPTHSFIANIHSISPPLPSLPLGHSTKCMESIVRVCVRASVCSCVIVCGRVCVGVFVCV